MKQYIRNPDGGNFPVPCTFLLINQLFRVSHRMREKLGLGPVSQFRLCQWTSAPTHYVLDVDEVCPPTVQENATVTRYQSRSAVRCDLF
jgi:hypothetical protein